MNNKIKYGFFGASHDEEIGAFICGINEGELVNEDKLQALLNRRKPSDDVYSTSRKEPDTVEFIQGIKNGKTTGEKIVARIKNKDVKKGDYSQYFITPRPSHADFSAIKKYGEDYTVSGGGQFSGRMTASYCIAGGIALQILERMDIEVLSYVRSVGDIQVEQLSDSQIRFLHQSGEPLMDGEEKNKIIDLIEKQRQIGDSLGGVVECRVLGLPAGLGEPMLGSIEGAISNNAFAIPGVKGVEFGKGFAISSMKGSEANDQFYYEGNTVKTYTNNSGGINGGLTNGMPVVFSVAFRPTPSIAVEQKTINLKTGENTTIKIKGRHDACFVMRTPPVVEAMTALAILPLVYNCEDFSFSSLRSQIDAIDGEVARLLEQRFTFVERIGRIKKQSGFKIEDKNRELEIINSVSAIAGRYGEKAVAVYEEIFNQSKKLQCKKYALLGKPLKHSYSKDIYAWLGLDYEHKEVDENQLIQLIKSGEYDGFNVTVPYKKIVASMLDELDETAISTGAVNVIKMRNRRLIGYNTDVYGLEYLLRSEGVCLADKAVTVLGSGGASLAVQAVCKRNRAKSVTIVSRTGAVNYSNCYGKTDIIINATPVGMYPNDDSPIDLNKFNGLEAVIDLVYNPIRTRLVSQARELGVKAVGGLKMLVAQAVASYEIFTGDRLPDKKVEEVYSRLLVKKTNVALIGMPFSGKSAVGQALADKLGRQFVDTDALIENNTGKSVGEIFNECKEQGFRAVEKQAVKEAFQKDYAIISTGGGAVIDAENRYQIQKNSIVIHLSKTITPDNLTGRPLVNSVEDYDRLNNEREGFYRDLGDFCVYNDGEISDTVNKIIELLWRA